MKNKTLVFILAYFFCFSNVSGLIQNETAQKHIEDPFVANRMNNIPDGMLLCCKIGTTYLPGLDQCVPNFVSTLYNESFPDYLDPNDGLTDCPDGYVSHSTKEIKLEKGKLKIGGDKWLESNDFCINRVEEEHPTSNGSFVARYCVPDPCDRLGRLGCIRKCCPSGMAMVTKYYHDLPITICESHQEPLNLSILRNPKNESIDQGSFFTRGGLGIKCGDLPRDRYGISSFSIDHDGQILFYSKDHPNGDKTDEYCIDNLVGNVTMDVVALGCFPEQVEDSKGTLLFGCLNLIATPFLIATLAVYFLLNELRNIHGVTVMCFLSSMTIQYIFHAILMLVRGSDMPAGLCPTLAISLHFAFIATFSWLNVLCYGIWHLFRSITSSTNSSVWSKTFFFYSVYGWGVPLIIVAVGQILQHSDVPDYIIIPGLNSNLFCWFNPENRGPLIAYLYGPMMAMIGANVFMFVSTASNFCRKSVEYRNSKRFKEILSLFLLMGVPWSTEVITFMAQFSFENALFFDIFNILLPLFIFVILICKRSIWKKLKFSMKRRGKLATGEESQSNSNNSTGSKSSKSACQIESPDS